MTTVSSTLSNAHLRTLLADAEAVRAEAERLRAELTDAQLTWKPAPDVWSVADCFEHLRRADKAYGRALPEAIGRMEPGGGPFRPSLFGGWFIKFASPESGMKLKAPKAIRPRRGGPSTEAGALGRFLDQQAALLGLIQDADGKDLNTGTFPSPLLGLIRFTVGEALTLLVRHEQRHLGQALRVTEHPGFPRA
ncbi:MAG: DinB family protein [Bacteroidota bacterium]